MKNKKLDRAIITICMGEEFRRLAYLTHPMIHAYAKKINADFIIINEPFLSKLFNLPNFEKFQIYSLFKKYQRILYIDTDVIINQNCPDLFKITPEKKIGVFVESNFIDRKNCIEAIQKRLGSINWKEKYFNTGVMVISKQHEEVFHITDDIYVDDFSEQTQINYNVQKLKIKIYDIGYKFNHMSLSKNSHKRFNSFIIHYAGLHHKVGKSRIDAIKKDLKLINNNILKIKCLQ